MRSSRIITFLKYLVISLAILLALILICVNLPFSQRLITEKVNGLFQRKGIPARVGKITLLINGKVGTDRLQLIDATGDTIIYGGQVRASARLVPLLFRKVKINSLAINNAVVRITTDRATGKPDLLALFATGENAPEAKEKSRKKWDISVSAVNLKNVRLTYDDAFHGIYLNPTVGTLSVKLDDLSLSERQVNVSVIEMADVHGGITLEKKPYREKNQRNEAAPAWSFKLSKADLSDVSFFVHQPDYNRRMEYVLAKGDISDATVSLSDHRITVKELFLKEPVMRLFSASSDSNRKPEATDKSPGSFPGPWNISGDDLKISDGSIQTGDYNNRSGVAAADAHFNIDGLNTALRNLRLNSKEAGFKINTLSFALDNGFKLERGEVVFDSDATGKSVLDAKLRTASSRVRMEIQIGGKLADVMKSYRTVTFSLKIDDTRISAPDIRAFLPVSKELPSEMRGENSVLRIACAASGTADLINLENLTLSTSDGVTFSVAGKVMGMTKPPSALCFLDFRADNITNSGLTELIKIPGSSVKLPDFNTLAIRGNISDSLSSPEFHVALQTSSDTITIDGSANMAAKKYSMALTGYSEQLGKLTGIKDLGHFSGVIHLDGEGFKPATMRIKAGIVVDSVLFRAYDYHDIKADITGANGQYRFTVIAGDPSLSCDLGGTVSFGDVLTGAGISGSFTIDAGNLNLYKDIRAGGFLEAAWDRSPDGMTGSFSLKNLALSSAAGTGQLENLSLSFQSSDTLMAGRVESDFMDARVRVMGSANDIKKAFSQGKLRLAAIVDSTVSNRIPIISLLPETSLSFEATYNPIIGILMNDSLFSYSKVSANMTKEATGNASSVISIDRFSFGNGGGFGTTLHLTSVRDTTVLKVSADSIQFGNIKLADLTAGIATTMDTAFYSLKASDRNDRLIYDIAGEAYKNEGMIRLRSIQPDWTVNGFTWSVSQGEFLVLDPANRNFIADLHWKNDQSTIDIHGGELEKIFIEVRNVWINMLVIPGMNTYGYDGELTGRIGYSGKDGNDLDIKMDIRQTKTYVSPIGDFRITASYLSDTLGTVEGDLNAVLNDTSSLNLVFRSELEGNKKSMHSEFADIPLNTFESLVSKYISGLTGEVSGELSLSSTGRKPRLDGEIHISGTELKIIPLNARFYLPDDVIRLENNKLVFRQFKVLDSLEKQLTLNGSINLENPENITADLQVTSDRIQVMNTTERENPSFNGSVFVDTKLNITGPVQSPSIAGNIVLAKGTVINYMYAENLTVSETEKTITFAGLRDEEGGGKTEKAPVKTFTRSPDIEAAIEINPNSLFNFSISRGFDIGAQITGGGFLTYGLMPNKDISLSGTYEINQGTAQLKIPGWPRKDFTITPGSFLRWDGQVDNPELNVETISKVRGSYDNPVDGQTREVDFLVNMKLANRLSQLEIIFDVSSQDQYITSVFSSYSADERMKQAINLLIFERIELPGQTSSTAYLSQQINQFWETQLNQMTKSAFRNVDFSLGIDTYTQATDQGKQEVTSFSYAVKKEMFKDRGSVSVSGHMNDNSPGSTQTSNLIENFIFEYALDTARTKFIKIYRQQNYEDLLEGEVTKSGVGFIYRKNYDRISDIWRRKKKARQ